MSDIRRSSVAVLQCCSVAVLQATSAIRAAIPDDLDLLPEDGEEKNRRLYRGNAASRARLAADIKKAVDISVDIPEKLGQSADNPLG